MQPMTFPSPVLGFVLYAGLILGVAFVATPAKFLAPHLALPVALEVGRYTFRILNRLEWAILGAMLVWGLIQAPGFQWWATLVAVSALVAIETAWLLPALDARAQIVIAGGTPPAASLHRLFVGLEAAKVILLLSSAVPFSAPRLAAFAEGATSIL